MSNPAPTNRDHWLKIPEFNDAYKGPRKVEREEVPKAKATGKRRFGFNPDKSKYGKRHKPGEMNKTESSYAEMLESRRVAGEIIAWQFEVITLKLADDTRYTPDFVVLLADGTLEMVDAKGGGPIDPKSLVKIKCAAERFFQFQFVIAQKQSKKNGGKWTRKEF